jgi:hypothetical protein
LLIKTTTNHMKNSYKFLSLMLFLIASSTMAQNQKVWTGTSKLFGVNGATNPTSSVNWSVGNATGSSTTKLDTTLARAIFSRYTWVNSTANMIVDTVKVSETISGCVSAVVPKLVEVYALPTLTMGTNQTLCSGVAPTNFSFTIGNYANISSIGTFTISYELRAGSATGTALGSGSTASITGINSNTVNINTSAWPSLTANTTYYFVITNFGSEITTAGSNPAPGNLSTSDIAALPRTYTITVNPAITSPTIIAY